MNNVLLESFRRRIYSVMLTIGLVATIVAWLVQSAQGTATFETTVLLVIGLVFIPVLIVLTCIPKIPLRLIDFLTVCYIASMSVSCIWLNFYAGSAQSRVALESIYMWLPIIYLFTFFTTNRKRALFLSGLLWLLHLGVSLPFLTQNLVSDMAHINIQFHFMSLLFIAAFNFFSIYQQRLKLAQLNVDEVEVLANTDVLTQVANRRGMIDVLRKEQQRFSRYEHSFSVVMLDIDHFKQFNDNYGHDVGDQILLELARRIQNNLRDVDTLARWGGEEFMVILPETTFENAMHTAQHLCDEVRIRPLVDNHLISISCGVTEISQSDTIATLLKRVDEALYKAKDKGRNCVEGAVIQAVYVDTSDTAIYA